MIARVAKVGFVEEACLELGPERDAVIWRGGRECKRQSRGISRGQS